MKTTMRQSAARFLIGTAAMLLIGSALILLSFRLQFGHNTIDSAGRCRTVNEKIDLATNLTKPKIVFIGGSSVHWGINAEVAGNALGRDGLNFGTFAALGPEVILSTARRVLKPGDVAVLALEYNMYSERRLTSDAISFALGCDEEFLEAMSPAEFLRTAFATELLRPFHVLEWEVFGGGAGGGEPAPPPTRSKHGDPMAGAFKDENSPKMKERLKLYQPLNIEVDDEAMLAGAVRDFSAWAALNDVKVVATWPNTIWFPSYERDAAFSKIQNLYARYDVQMLGDPQIAMYPADLFYDTQYHLSDIGIERRTRDLVPVLKGELDDMPGVQRHAYRD